MGPKILRRWGRALLVKYGLRRHSLADPVCVLLGGISGSGKSTVCASVNPSAVVVELDRFLLETYSTLLVGPLGGDPFLYETWTAFLADQDSFEKCVDCFSAHLTECLHRQFGCFCIVVGNHFVVDGVVRMVTESTNSLSIPVIEKLAIVVPALTVYEQRRVRGNSYDLAVTPEDVGLELVRFKTVLGKQGFTFATREETSKRLQELCQC